MKQSYFSLLICSLLINKAMLEAASSSQQGTPAPTVHAGANLQELALQTLIAHPAELAKDLPALHNEDNPFYTRRYTLPAKSINNALLARLAYDTQQLDVNKDRLSGLAFSPDGKTVATWKRDAGTLILSDLQTGKVLRTLPHGNEDVQSAAFSPDGTLLTTGMRRNENNVWTGTARLWDPHTGKLLRIFPSDEHPTTYISATAFNADGSLIALASSNTVISLWDPATGAVIRTFTRPGIVGALAFSPDNTLLAVESTDGFVMLWNALTGELKRILRGDAGSDLSLRFTPDGSKLSAESSFGAIKIWNLTSGAPEFSLQRTQSSYLSATMSPDGSRVASMQGNIIRLWNEQTNELLHTGSIDGHGGSYISFSPDGKTLASETMRDVQLWDAETGTFLQFLPCDFAITGILFSPDNTILAAFSEILGMRSTIRLWRIDYQKDLQTIQDIEEQQFLLHAAQDWLAGKPHVVLQETYPIYQNLILRFSYLNDDRLFTTPETLLDKFSSFFLDEPNSKRRRSK